MKPSLMLPVLATAALFGLTACGKKESSAAAPSTAETSHADHAAAAAAPATPATAASQKAPQPQPSSAATAAAPAAGQEVVVEANDQMKFSVTRIEAKAGSTLSITLKNVGKLPKTAMGHNLVVLTKAANAMQFANAAMTAAKTEYVPPAMESQVVAHTKLLGPGESDTISFTVPSEPGEYVFLCSFPAHFMAGMKGLLVVTAP